MTNKLIQAFTDLGDIALWVLLGLLCVAVLAAIVLISMAVWVALGPDTERAQRARQVLDDLLEWLSKALKGLSAFFKGGSA